ncbi:phage neck terminator protein [Acetobacter cibinongensis]|uniref:phage neck terminator protein n=1 Tax=Acetobacter cibinongensis TaxID=146475 RepID=UPI001055A463|nr:hypothetical protein [Acetobacter cibinongensis]
MVQTCGNTPTSTSFQPVTPGITTALRAFLCTVLPATMPVLLGQQNRTAAPVGPFALLTLLSRVPLCTPSYTSTAQAMRLCVSEDITAQVSLFGPGAADHAQQIGFLFGSHWGCQFFQNLASSTQGQPQQGSPPTAPLTAADWLAKTANSPPQPLPNVPEAASGTAPTFQPARLSPLYATPPRNIPFISGEQQYEAQWQLDLHSQLNTVLILPQTTAPAARLVLVPSDAPLQEPSA